MYVYVYVNNFSSEEYDLVVAIQLSSGCIAKIPSIPRRRGENPGEHSKEVQTNPNYMPIHTYIHTYIHTLITYKTWESCPGTICTLLYLM